MCKERYASCVSCVYSVGSDCVYSEICDGCVKIVRVLCSVSCVYSVIYECNVCVVCIVR